MGAELVKEKLEKMKKLIAAILTLALTASAFGDYHRYVIKECAGQPCVLDTVTGYERSLKDDTAGRQLIELGFPRSDMQPLNKLVSLLWHPAKDTVALNVLLERRASAVWIWSFDGFRTIGPTEIARAIGFKAPEHVAPTLAAVAKKWKGDTLLIEVDYNATDASAPDRVAMRKALLSYDVESNSVMAR